MLNNPSIGGKNLPTLTNPGTAADLLAPKQLIGANGNVLTGTMPSKSASDITVSGPTITVPAGYYGSSVSKSVSSATQATPSITVSSGGLITASATQSAGYVAAGTKSATQQLTTQAAATITPGTSSKTAVAAGRYTTGAVTVSGDANLVASNIKSGVSIFGVNGSYGGGGTDLTFYIGYISNTSAISQSFSVTISNLPTDATIIYGEFYLIETASMSKINSTLFPNGYEYIVSGLWEYSNGERFAATTIEYNTSEGAAYYSAGGIGTNISLTRSGNRLTFTSNTQRYFPKTVSGVVYVYCDK